MSSMSEGLETENRSFVRLWLVLMQTYPARTLRVVSLLLLAGFFEGVGFLTVLPLLALAAGDEQQAEGISRLVLDALRTLGLGVSVGALLFVIVLGITLKAALTILASREAGYASSDVARDMRMNLMRGLMRARWDHFSRQLVGTHANSMGTEALRAAAVYETGSRMIAAAMQVLAYVVIALLVSPYVTLVSLLFGIIIFFSLNFVIQASRRAGARQTALLRSLTARLTQSLTAIKPLKAMHREANFQMLLEQEINEVNEAQRKQVIATAALPAVQEPMIVAVMAAGVYMYLTRLNVSFEQLTFIALLFYRTATRIGNLQVALQKFVSPESAFWALRDSIRQAEAAKEVDAGTEDPPLRNAISMRDLTLQYGAKVVLSGFSIDIPCRKVTALLGPSGVGKTSVADLVVGLVKPTSGDVFIDDVPLSRVSLTRWRSRVGYVPQETFLFHDTVAVNVSLNDPTITGDEVERALRIADAWDFVTELPDGVESVVGERGTLLSGGQRQRIAIARALVAHPDLLILDEATVALDPETEIRVYGRLKELSREMTILAISHQMALTDIADQVVLMSEDEVRATTG